MDMTAGPLDEPIARSLALNEHLECAFQLPAFGHDVRYRTSILAGSLALEHGAALRVLLSLGLGIFAAVLLRAQYEATLRSVWLCYSASDEEVHLLSADLSAQTDALASKLPQAANMLMAIDGKAPPEAVQSLRNFRTNAWGPLNSFVHAGVHSINRHEQGLPLPVAEGALRSSNALNVVAAMQCAVATGNQALVSQVGKAQAMFAACF
jgi:hypothetical protein